MKELLAQQALLDQYITVSFIRLLDLRDILKKAFFYLQHLPAGVVCALHLGLNYLSGIVR